MAVGWGQQFLFVQYFLKLRPYARYDFQEGLRYQLQYTAGFPIVMSSSDCVLHGTTASRLPIVKEGR